MFPPQTRFHNSPALLRLKTLLEKNRASPAAAPEFRPSPELAAKLERLRVMLTRHKGRVLDAGFNPSELRDRRGRWSREGEAADYLSAENTGEVLKNTLSLNQNTWSVGGENISRAPPVSGRKSASPASHSPASQLSWETAWQLIPDNAWWALYDYVEAYLQLADALGWVVSLNHTHDNWVSEFLQNYAEETSSINEKNKDEILSHWNGQYSRVAGTMLSLLVGLLGPSLEVKIGGYVLRLGGKGLYWAKEVAPVVKKKAFEKAQSLYESLHKPLPETPLPFIESIGHIDKDFPAAQSNPLSEAEVDTPAQREAIKALFFLLSFALRHYTGEAYKVINYSWRLGKPTLWAKWASKAIEKVAQPVREGKTLYRVLQLSPEEIQEYYQLCKSRNVLRHLPFLSTSISRPVNGMIGGIKGNVQWRITAGRGYMLKVFLSLHLRMSSFSPKIPWLSSRRSTKRPRLRRTVWEERENGFLK